MLLITKSYIFHGKKFATANEHHIYCIALVVFNVDVDGLFVATAAPFIYILVEVELSDAHHEYVTVTLQLFQVVSTVFVVLIS